MTLTFDKLRTTNIERNNDVFKHSIESWSINDWMTAVAGELGEAANIAKKIHRGDFTLDQAKDEFANELADVVCYLDLLAARAGIDLGEAVRRKFNIVSQRRGSDIRL